MIILVDMDNTLVDFDEGLLRIWRILYPNEFFVPLKKRTTFHPHNDYPEHLQTKVKDICHSKNFIRNLPPTPGGIEAIHEMLKKGHDVRFCSSHLLTYDPSVLEKYYWIEKHFDASFVDRIILTRDKTLIRGDILIDDKPEISGIEKPAWEHILYDRSFNRGVANKRRLDWQNWRDILDLDIVA
jgi:5'-nucleotidase